MNSIKMSIINNRTGQNSSTSDNDLPFTPQDLNDLAIRIGADLGLPDINDIHVVDDSGNNDMLSNVDESQVIIQEEKNQLCGDGSGDVDMETIVIETITNDVDMSDAIVFGNVGNEVSISSSSPFERQTVNTASSTSTLNKVGPVSRRTKSGPPKIRGPQPQQIRFTNQMVSTTQPQIIPISALNLGQFNTTTTQLIPASMGSQSKQQPKGKIIKKGSSVGTSFVQTNQLDSSSTLKVIYTSQGQQIVFSPSKQSTSMNSTVVTVPNTSVAPPGKVLLRPVAQTMTKTMAGMTSSQPQQVIILSPMKASAGVPTIAPAAKAMPYKSQQIIAAKSPQRALAPAPTQPKIAISKAMSHSTDIKPVQLIRVVPISSAQAIQQVSTPSTISSSKLVPLRPIAPNTNLRAMTPISQPTHKVIVPTSAIKGNATITTSTSSLSQTTFLTTSGPSNTGQVFMLPNPSLLKITPTTTTASSSTHSTKSVSFANPTPQRTNFVPIAPSPMTTSSSANTSLTAAQMSSLKITNGSTKVEDPHQRKPCNCTKSQCLKLYCDCFANGEFCSSCNCISCHNNLDHEEDRQKAIRQCLERNPHAFHPKIGKGRAGDTERRHTKGCNCRRSGCLKNYCECYEAKILCSSLCKCCGCKNFEESFERKTLMHLADAAEVRSAQQNVATKNRLWGSDFKPKLPIRVDGDRLPCSFITPEVVEATCQCLLAQAEHGEKHDLDFKQIETLVLEEFGRCLTQIIECATKTRNSKFKQEFI